MATSTETSIATVKKLDVDTLMSDDFNMESYLNDGQSQAYNSASTFVDKNELEAQTKNRAALQEFGYAGEDVIKGGESAARVMFNSTTEQGVWGGMQEGWRNNKLQMSIADIRWAEMNNQISHDEAERQANYWKSQIKNRDSKGLASWMKSAAGVVPMALETTQAGLKMGTVGGLAGAGVAAVAGQLGPQVALPEEIVTVPGGFAVGFTPMFSVGTIKRASEIEAGLMYDELVSFKDDAGRKIDPAIAKSAATGLGVVNGLLELVQIKDIIKTVPGGSKILRKATSNTVKSLAKNKSLMKVIADSSVRYGKNVGIEAGTEIAQEIDNVIFGELSKQLSNGLAGTNIDPASVGEITTRIVETAKESAKAFAVIAAPGNIIHAAGQTLPEGTAKPTVSPDVKVENIARIVPASEKIPVRVNIEGMGAPTVEQNLKMPERKKSPPREKVEKPLTPEEELLSQQSEATLKAEEPFEITPKLYIGNVTKRMKAVFANALDAIPTNVSDFLDGAFPTKRTPIKLDMGEARQLLIHMESNLQDRLDKNQINTDADLAHANADWGDIKELRNKLGLPTTTRPFTVIRATGTKHLTIENTAERIGKAVQISKADKVTVTQMDRLNNVMRNIAKSTKEGWKGGKAEARKAYAELQYLRKQKELRDKLISNIGNETSDDKVDFFYREAIAGIQDALDFKAKGTQKKSSLEKLLADNPDKANDIPKRVLETLAKKNVDSLSFQDLININNEIKRLEHIGRVKSDLFKAQRAKYLSTKKAEFVSNITSAKKGLLPTKERANTLKPTRLFDMLDGGKKFKGAISEFFYGQTNENYNSELKNTDARQRQAKKRLAELGLSLSDFAKQRVVGDLKMTLDQAIGIYAGWKNAESRMAIRFGGIAVKKGWRSKVEYVEITDAIYNQIVESLSESEKLWGDTVIQDYAENYDRMRLAVIEAENRDPGHAENYTKIRRLDVEYTSAEEEVIAELNRRHYFKQAGLHKGFSIERKNIPAEYQTPIDLSLTKVWMNEIRKQEHYINNAVHLKDMRSVMADKDFRNLTRDKFGESMTTFIDDYIKRIANPDYYKVFSDLESCSKILRRHTAIAYIAGNLSSYANQIPSILTYWSASSVGDVLGSAMQAALHPVVSYEKARDAHYQISHVSIEREIQELERIDPLSYKSIVDRVGRVGMFGIFAIDRAIRVIGINAVVANGIRKGLSVKEAQDNAAKVTLLTQEATSPKDMARIYASNEFLNWFLMFTNQLNQIYNITTYDIPAAWKNKDYRDAARSTISLVSMAMIIWMIQNRRLPEEPDEVGDALAENFLSSIPIVGSAITAGTNGWTTQPAPLKAASSLGRAGVSATEGDWEKVLEQLAEPVSIATGFPYVGAKDAYSFIEEIN